MGYPTVSELVRPIFRSFGGVGTVAMLECYFDDSGTHEGSQVVAWGGLIGAADSFDAFTLEWNKLLAAPLLGKLPIKNMHLTSLRNGKGEFLGYSQGEIDLLTKKFRDIIIQCGLECIAYIALVPDWFRASKPIDRRAFRGPKDFAFLGVLEAIEKMSRISDGALSCHFDVGAQDDILRMHQEIWTIFNPVAAEKTAFTFSPVAKVAGLQGADMVAHEAYHYGLHLIDECYPENPHFIALRNGTNVAFFSLHESEMIERLKLLRGIMGLGR